MIRFIDLRHEDIGARFSFWSTVSDNYIHFYAEAGWGSWDEFESDFWSSMKTANNGELERFKNLCPPWVFKEIEDDCN